jgi:hypothetical protein
MLLPDLFIFQGLENWVKRYFAENLDGFAEARKFLATYPSCFLKTLLGGELF